MTTPTTELPELPAHLVFIDQYDDSIFGSITDDAWERDESSELKLGAPLFTAGQMRAYGEDRERALLARLGEQQPFAWALGLPHEPPQEHALWSTKPSPEDVRFAEVQCDMGGLAVTPLYTTPTPIGEQQPAAWLWQHEETGRSGFVDAWQVENGWQEANPRNKIIRPVYYHPSPAPVGAQERDEQEQEQHIELVAALEMHRALGIVDDVAALPVGGKDAPMPTPFQAGYQLACEEITERLRTQVTVLPGGMQLPIAGTLPSLRQPAEAARSAAQGAVQVPAWRPISEAPTDMVVLAKHPKVLAAHSCTKRVSWVWPGELRELNSVGGPLYKAWMEIHHPDAAAPAHAGERQGDSA